MAKSKKNGQDILLAHLETTEVGFWFIDVLLGRDGTKEGRDLWHTLHDAGVEFSERQVKKIKFHYSDFTGWGIDVPIGPYEISIAPNGNGMRLLWMNVTFFAGTNSGSVFGAILLPTAASRSSTKVERAQKFLTKIAKHHKKVQGR